MIRFIRRWLDGYALGYSEAEKIWFEKWGRDTAHRDKLIERLQQQVTWEAEFPNYDERMKAKCAKA